MQSFGTSGLACIVYFHSSSALGKVIIAVAVDFSLLPRSLHTLSVFILGELFTLIFWGAESGAMCVCASVIQPSDRPSVGVQGIYLDRSFARSLGNSEQGNDGDDDDDHECTDNVTLCSWYIAIASRSGRSVGRRVAVLLGAQHEPLFHHIETSSE